MNEFLAPINYDRARDVLRRLDAYARYTPEGARQVRAILEECYPLIFSRYGDVYLLTSYGSLLAFFVMGWILCFGPKRTQHET